MGYRTSKGQWVSGIAQRYTETALAADATGTVIELGKHRSVSAKLNVTAVSASDSLDLTIEGSDDEGATWTTLCTFTQATDATTERKTFVGMRKIRPNFNVTGASISIAFTLDIEAV